MIKGDQAAALRSFHAGGEARHETQLLNSVICDDGCLGEGLKAQKEVQCLGNPTSFPENRMFALLLKGCRVSQKDFSQRGRPAH